MSRFGFESFVKVLWGNPELRRSKRQKTAPLKKETHEKDFKFAEYDADAKEWTQLVVKDSPQKGCRGCFVRDGKCLNRYTIIPYLGEVKESEIGNHHSFWRHRNPDGQVVDASEFNEHPEFIAGSINEPSAGESINCMVVYCSESTLREKVEGSFFDKFNLSNFDPWPCYVTIKDIKENEELLATYGSDFNRTYVAGDMKLPRAESQFIESELVN